MVLDALLHTLYPGAAYSRLTGQKFPIAVRRAYWVHINRLDEPTYAAQFAAGVMPT